MTHYFHRLSIGLVLVVATAVLAAPPAKTGRIQFKIHTLIKDLNEGCDVADINADGKLDVIAGKWWYEAPSWTQHPVRDLEIKNDEYYDTNGDHAMDLNGDAYPDTISASWFNAEIYWYEDPGAEGLAAGKKWARHLVYKTRGEVEGTILADLDDDGIAELLISSWELRHRLTIVRIRPGTNGQPPTFIPFETGGPGYGHGIGVGDINGDGRKDIYVPYGWYEAPVGNRFAKPWNFHKDYDYGHSSVPCLVEDINGDGRNDLLIGKGHDYGLYWLENTPGENGKIHWIEHLIDKSFSQAHALAWADLDGDGHDELITGKRWRGHKGTDPGADEPVCIFRYVWDPDTQAFEKDVISYDQGVGIGMQIRIADLNQDGRLDIVVAGKTGTYILFNEGPAPTATHANYTATQSAAR
jgi:hypothetical protein